MKTRTGLRGSPPTTPKRFGRPSRPRSRQWRHAPMPKHYKPPTPDSSEDTSLTGSTSGASVSPPEDAGQPGAPGSSSESGGGGNAASRSVSKRSASNGSLHTSRTARGRRLRPRNGTARWWAHFGQSSQATVEHWSCRSRWARRRKKYTPTVCLPPVNLAPSSTSAQMASAELAASLSYHLVKGECK